MVFFSVPEQDPSTYLSFHFLSILLSCLQWQQCSQLGLFSACWQSTGLERLLIKWKKRVSSWQRKDAEGTSNKQSDYSDDIALLANTPAQAETLLHSQERAAAGIGLQVNAHKTEYMCFNERGDMSTLVDKFTYLGSSVSSTETDINTWLTKAWTGIDRLPVIWKSDLTDKMKRSFFQAAVMSILLYRCTTWTLTKRLEMKLDGNLHKNAASNIEQVMEAAPHKAAAVLPLTTHHENYPS